MSDPRWSEALAHLPDYLGNHVRVSVAALALGLLISLPLAFGVAVASWHLVEKHALRLRGRVETFEAAVLSRMAIVGFWRRPPERVELRASLGNSSASI